MTLLYETPGLRDAVLLAGLKAATFTEAFAEDNDPEQLRVHVARAFTAAAISAELADPNTKIVWVKDAGRPVAYMKVNHPPAHTEGGLDGGLEVEQLYVRASHYRQGIAAALLAQAVEIAQSNGLRFVWLGVWERNIRAITAYEHLGFKTFGAHTFRFGDDEQTDVLMRLPVAN